MADDLAGARHYVFYHDRARLDSVIAGVADNPQFNFIDLNLLAVPDFLRIPELSEDMNRVVLSEYLGLASVKPDSEMVGMFTYSIPMKFNARWAARTGFPQVFLPEITFRKIAAATFHRDRLYAPEFDHPQQRFAQQIDEIHRQFRVGADVISAAGPYKGSLVVAGDCFREFADWFRPVCLHLLRTFDWRAGGGVNSPFSASAHAGKSALELEADRMRHGLGGLLERVVAYYFGQRFPSEKKIRLGPYLARRRR